MHTKQCSADKLILTFIKNLLCVSQCVECIPLLLYIEVIMAGKLNTQIICNGNILVISSSQIAAHYLGKDKTIIWNKNPLPLKTVAII